VLGLFSRLVGIPKDHDSDSNNVRDTELISSSLVHIVDVFSMVTSQLLHARFFFGFVEDIQHYQTEREFGRSDY
jgi:hypothetical protein